MQNTTGISHPERTLGCSNLSNQKSSIIHRKVNDGGWQELMDVFQEEPQESPIVLSALEVIAKAASTTCLVAVSVRVAQSSS